MTAKALPSPEVLRQLLRYEPETGKLFWLARNPDWFSDGGKAASHSSAVWNTNFAGKAALATIMANGYLAGKILGKGVYAHRAIMTMDSGRWPDHEVDHINGDPSDNRMANLRLATRSQNALNTCLSKRNASGWRGVWFDGARQKWAAMIGHDGKRTSLGRFGSKDAAIAAYAEASERLHREFRRPLT